MRKFSTVAVAATFVLALGASSAQAGYHGGYHGGGGYYGGHHGCGGYGYYGGHYNDAAAIALGVTGALFGAAALATAVSPYYVAPAVVAPAPVYYAPAPVYYAPAPVYYAPPVYYTPRY
jgi:hypothetical protein